MITARRIWSAAASADLSRSRSRGLEASIEGPERSRAIPPGLTRFRAISSDLTRPHPVSSGLSRSRAVSAGLERSQPAVSSGLRTQPVSSSSGRSINADGARRHLLATGSVGMVWRFGSCLLLRIIRYNTNYLYVLSINITRVPLR